jgi:hypothetical protein
MGDENEPFDDFTNWCADLVTTSRMLPALGNLYQAHPLGQWVALRELYHLCNLPNEAIPESLVVAWLPSPQPGSEDTVVQFFDNDSLWSMVAVNTQRRELVGSAISHSEPTKNIQGSERTPDVKHAA